MPKLRIQRDREQHRTQPKQEVCLMINEESWKLALSHRTCQELHSERTQKDIARHYTNRHIPPNYCCELCGSTESLEHHHFNYWNPNDVITVCKTCHGEITRLTRQYTRDELNAILTDKVFTRFVLSDNERTVRA